MWTYLKQLDFQWFQKKTLSVGSCHRWGWTARLASRFPTQQVPCRPNVEIHILQQFITCSGKWQCLIFAYFRINLYIDVSRNWMCSNFQHLSHIGRTLDNSWCLWSQILMKDKSNESIINPPVLTLNRIEWHQLCLSSMAQHLQVLGLSRGASRRHFTQGPCEMASPVTRKLPKCPGCISVPTGSRGCV